MSASVSRPRRAPKPRAWQRIADALLLIDAKGVYARTEPERAPGKQETNPHHATPA